MTYDQIFFEKQEVKIIRRMNKDNFYFENQCRRDNAFTRKQGCSSPFTKWRWAKRKEQGRPPSENMGT